MSLMRGLSVGFFVIVFFYLGFFSFDIHESQVDFQHKSLTIKKWLSKVRNTVETWQTYMLD